MLWPLAVVLWAGAAGALVPSPGPVVGIGGTQGRCTYQTAYRMKGAHCSALNLHSVPATLKYSIEILDLSFNRIRDLRNTTFQRYTIIRYLYLGDNMIQSIEAGAFEPLSSLETLDLSLNALTTIPAFILNLPSLRKLYMADNALTNLHNDLKNMEKPVKAPLNFLSLSNCQLTEFPDFGVMSELEHLNVSANVLRSLDPEQFAKLCALKTLDVTGSMYAQDTCTYKPSAVWFIEKQITIIPDMYTVFNPESEDARRCPEVQFSEDIIKEFTECRNTVKTRKLEKVARKTWIIIAGSLGGFLFCFIILLYWLHRRNVKQTKKSLKKMQIKAENPTNNTANLLSDVS